MALEPVETVEAADEPQQPTIDAPPEDFRAYEKWREDGGGSGSGDDDNKEDKPVAKPAVGRAKTPPSEPPEKTPEGQTALDSDSEDDQEQEEEEDEKEEIQEQKPGKPNQGIDRRIRQLTGKIKKLESQLAVQHQPEDDEEADGEVVSPPEPVAAAEVEAAAPMLKDFEDTDTESAWDQYEKATRAFHKAETAKAIATALAQQAQDLELKHSQQTAQADWNKAASRYPDYNEVVREEVKISQAMESVMRMDPETGTDLAYYLGQHPEESERIAQATLATNEKQWTIALARAGMELGILRGKLTPPSTLKKPAASGPPRPGSSTTPAPTPQTKKISSASTPPPKIRGGAPVTPAFDLMNDDDAARDVGKWMREREKQLAASGKR